MARRPAMQEIEELPEADRLEPFPHPRHTDRLFGHETGERILAETFRSGRVHHAWLIAGEDGIGKATLAYRFAKFALARASGSAPEVQTGSLPVDPQSAGARQVRALSHPGLLVIRRRYDAQAKRFPAVIGVDEVRRLRAFLAHAAEPGAWRIVIVDRADELNVNAANALLKALEEPPARTVFLLVSAAPGRLIATIRSRCRRLDLEPLGTQPLQEAAVQALAAAELDSIPAPDWPRLERLARGSVRRLLLLSRSQGLADYERALAIIRALPKVDWTAVHALADAVAAPGAEQRFENFFELLLSLLGRLIHVAATGEPQNEETELAVRLIQPARLAWWAELWERVQRKKADVIALNLDRRALVLTTIANIEAAARA